jgi:hypothetical protein
MRMQEGFGEIFYENLLSNFPKLLDYFAHADMDSLASHIILAIIDLICNQVSIHDGSLTVLFQ